IALLHAVLEPDELSHLQRLLGSWSLLSDLSFSDLVLVVPVGDDEGAAEAPLVVLGQIRPSNRPTRLNQDLVGQSPSGEQWSIAVDALERGELVRGDIDGISSAGPIHSEAIPVRFGDKVIAVIVRIGREEILPATSNYERTYLDAFDRLGAMVAESAFPFPEEDVGSEEAPRVGDGVVVVDHEGRVEFASPNAMNAFHRMGVHSVPEGRRFVEMGVEESALEWALTTARPVVEEVERRPDIIVLLHCIPLVTHGSVSGAIILVRDVTDVRRLDRLLLSKDAAIREVHHRVKNNLQTISSLLRLQARRVPAKAGREALHEAERRVRSIAIVHEILSREPGDQVSFDEIVGSLVQMAEDSVVGPARVQIDVAGDLGDLPADIATPLAVALAELLQNAVQHAFAVERRPLRTPRTGKRKFEEQSRGGRVTVGLAHGGEGLTIDVRDDGVGLPKGFDIERTNSLGLSIVRDLVVSQLDGTIEMRRVTKADGGGTLVSIAVPMGPRR
ncbi:MAG: sensor histidine kinase, partial [Acidimicrobiales bacterium]